MVLAFDSKEYRREKEIEGIRKTVFYSPLGVGVKFSETNDLLSVYQKICKEKAKSQAILDNYYIYSSGSLRKKYGDQRTIAFLEAILFRISEYIEKAFFSYVILPPDKIPFVTVGGIGCPTINVSTLKFLTQLNPMFSYITAWKYFVQNKDDSDDILIDSFSSKHTLAWASLQRRKPKIYRRGDEANLLISIADAIAYLTDKRLHKLHLRLEPDNIQEAWDSYNIETNVRFLSHKDLHYYRWYNFDDVDFTEFQARPILFLDLDPISMNTAVDLEPFNSAVAYISQKGGSLQGFDPVLDSPRIRDGDIYIYAGDKPKDRALAFNDIYDIEILTLKDLRSKVPI